jgi:hypothetical protein
VAMTPIKMLALAATLCASFATAHPAAAATTAHTFALPSAVVGGPLKLVRTYRYAHGGVGYSYEAKTLYTHPDGWVYLMVRANSPSHAAARSFARAFRLGEESPRLGGQPRSFPIDGGAFGGNPDVYSTVEVGPEGCRVTVTFPRGHAAVDVEVANFNLDTCDDGGWVVHHAFRLSKALLRRIPG